MNDFMAIVRTHAQRYPLMQPCDAVKLAYQNTMGGGHLIADLNACLHALRTEHASVTHGGNLLEEIGGGHFRLNLAALDEHTLPLACLCRLFILSSEQPSGQLSAFLEQLEVLRKATHNGIFSFNNIALDEYLTQYRSAGYPPARHSDIYRNAYHPAYRVLDEKFVRLLPIIERINQLMATGKPVVVAIDGCAASGKTTTAGLLSQVYESVIVHMDDFFLPPERRTPQRLAEADGNIDYERFASEVLPALHLHLPIRHRVFSCATGAFSGENALAAAPLTIVEGVYSHHPSFGPAYDLRVFLSVPRKEQEQRIINRNGAMASMFFEQWIPMENNYFTQFSIRQNSDLVIEN